MRISKAADNGDSLHRYTNTLMRGYFLARPFSERIFGMDWYSTKGKSKLIRELMDKGLSVRKAEKAVNAVFDCMAKAVRRGETVEIPGGTIQAKIRNNQPRRQWTRLRNVRTGKIASRIINYPGPRRMVRFEPDHTLDLSPLPAPPVPETPEQVETRQHVVELLGRSPSPAEMSLLAEAGSVHARGPNSLLLRLRDRKSRGRSYTNADELARDLESMYWL